MTSGDDERSIVQNEQDSAAGEQAGFARFDLLGSDFIESFE